MPDLTTIEQQLTTQLGVQETSSGTAGVGVSLNNPGALRYAPWEGTYGGIPDSSGYASFPSLTQGWNALSQWVKTNVGPNTTLTSLINTYAPVSDNNTNNPQRISNLASITGLDPSQTIYSQVGAASPITNGDVLSQGVTDATTPPPVDSSGQTLADKSVFKWSTISLSRVSAFLLGAIFLIIGLLSLKQTQVVVQNTVDKVSKTAEAVAPLAA